MTAYMRLKGKSWKVALPMFGETVEYKRKTNHKLDSRWEQGVYLGIRMDTTEKIVGTSHGIFVVQSIRRVPESSWYNVELLGSIRGVPWKPQAGNAASGEADDAQELPGCDGNGCSPI